MRNYIRYRPNLKLTPTLAYVLGVLKGDASCSQKRIQFTTIDEPFALTFAAALFTLGLNPHIRSIDCGKYKAEKHVYAISKVFDTWYQGLDWNDMLTRLGRDENLILQFFRGFYESEGSFIKTKNPTGSFRYRIHIANIDKELLERIAKVLLVQGYHFKFYQQREKQAHRKTLYRLVLHRRYEIERLLKTICPCIPRKQWNEPSSY